MPVQTSFGGADPTLVTAATRAGLASAPRDYGKAFQAVADSYHKMVTANAEIWSKVIWAAGTKIADEIKTYTESPPVSEEAADMMGKDGGKWLKEELERIKGAMKETLGITKKVKTEGKEGKEGWMITPGTEDDPVAATEKTKFNNPVSKENKEIRAKLLAERNDLYANLQHQVDNADAAYGFFQLGDAPGGVWGEATGIEGMEINNALIATRRGEVTARGNYMVYERGENDKLKFTMYSDATKAESYDPKTNTIEDPFDPNSRIPAPAPGPVMKNGERMRYDASEIKNMLILNPTEDKAGNSLLQKSMEKDLTDVMQLGFGSQTGEMTPYTKNRVNGVSKKYSDSRAAWHTRTWAGEGGASFFEETTSVSAFSANLFNAANQHLNWDDISKEMVNVKGTSPGIDEADFTGGGEVARQNLLTLQSTLFNTGNKYYSKAQTAGVFEEWFNNKMSGVFTEGFNQKQKSINNNGRTDGKGLGSIKESGMFEGGSDSWMSEQKRSQITTIANLMDARSPIGKGKSAITWDDVRKSYFLADGNVMATKEHLFETIFDKQLTRAFKTSPFYTAITDWDGKQYLKKEEKEKPGFGKWIKSWF